MNKVKYFYDDDAHEMGNDFTKKGINRTTHYLILKGKCRTDFRQTEAKVWHDLYQDCKKQFVQLQKCNINKERIKEKIDKVLEKMGITKTLSKASAPEKQMIIALAVKDFVERFEKELKM